MELPRYKAFYVRYANDLYFLYTHSLANYTASFIQCIPNTMCGYRRLSLATLAARQAGPHTDTAPKHSLSYLSSVSE